MQTKLSLGHVGPHTTGKGAIGTISIRENIAQPPFGVIQNTATTTKLRDVFPSIILYVDEQLVSIERVVPEKRYVASSRLLSKRDGQR